MAVEVIDQLKGIQIKNQQHTAFAVAAVFDLPRCRVFIQ